MTHKVPIARNTSQSSDLFGFCNFNVSPYLSSAASSPHECSCCRRETAHSALALPSENKAVAEACGTQCTGTIHTGLVQAGVGPVFIGEQQHIITLLTEEQPGVSAAIPFFHSWFAAGKLVQPCSEQPLSSLFGFLEWLFSAPISFMLYKGSTSLL